MDAAGEVHPLNSHGDLMSMFGTYNRLNLHVSATNREVIRVARLLITEEGRRDPAKREQRKAFYRQMLNYHAGAQALVRDFRL